VEHATVVRVDAGTGAIEAVVPVGPDPLLLAVASGRIWTANLGDGTLSRVDPSSNEATTVRPGEVVGIASDARDLWVARDGNVVARLDGETGDEMASFVLGPKPLFELRDAGFLGVGRESVWLTVPQLGEPDEPHSLWRLDQETGEVRSRLPLGRDVLPPLVDDRYVWIIAMGERTLTRVDQRSGEAADVPVGPLPLALAAGAGSLWVGHESSPEVWRIDPDTLEVTAMIDIEGRLRGIGLGGGLVWVTTETGLVTIDPATDQVTQSVPLGEFEPETGPRAIGDVGGSVWVSVE
jgi:DNA-binding beta-propeller fold protein YncE